MANGSTGKFLHGQMAHVVALEADVQAALEALSTNTHPGITAMANDIAALTQGQGAPIAIGKPVPIPMTASWPPSRPMPPRSTRTSN